MDQHARTIDGHGVIERVFALSRRGHVLVLNKHFRGVVPHNGSVETSRGAMPYTGPEFADGNARDARLAIIIADGHGAEALQPGEQLVFYGRA